MKTPLLLFMFLLSCNKNNLTFNQKVKIIDGFYEGCIGRVEMQHARIIGPQNYTIKTVNGDCPLFINVESNNLLPFYFED